MIYRNVYFRIDTGYQWGKGLDQDKVNVFYDEITMLFINSEWDVEIPASSGHCPVARKNKNRLYLHPMEASGEIQEDMINEIELLLSQGKTFKYDHTDIYEVLLDMTDDEYKTHLESKQLEIEEDILKGFTTKRKNLFVTQTGTVVEKVKEKYHIPRIQEHLGRASSNIEWMFVANLFKRMIEDGWFTTAQTKNGIGYRTA